MTEDGGATWTRVIVPDSASTGAIDVAINRTNPDIMLATTRTTASSTAAPRTAAAAASRPAHRPTAST